MDDIKDRLKDCSEKALESYEAWHGEKKLEQREDLQEAIHELRKVASRVEIEIAMSERSSGSSKQIPIPSHRSNSKSKDAVESILPDEGNTEAKPEKKQTGRRPQRGGRKTLTKKPS